jgi:competence protein ComEC
MPVLAGFGIPLRSRLLWILGLIAVYVPLAGAGPSIQRAGVMGGLSVLATLAGRRASRFHALALAAVVLLAVDPGIAVDIGWQLSFAAVLGILLLGPRLRAGFAARVGGRGWGGALADGAAMTVAATLATAPLIAFHFEALSTTTLFANLLAMPAVAPAMWLGILAAVAGQVPGFPVEVLNSLDAVLLAYIAQVAAWCGRPSWAYVHVRLSLAGLLAAYLAIAASAFLTARLCRLRRLRRARARAPVDRPKRKVGLGFSTRGVSLLATLAVGLVALLAVPGLLAPRGDAASGSPGGLRVSVLDVGQGDAILLQPHAGPALLVDGGPPGDGLAAKLREAGVARLGAVVLTHDQSDHVGGVLELLGAMPIDRVLYGLLGRSTLARIDAAGVPTRRLSGGAEIGSGRLRVSVLWPPASLLAGRHGGEDPNRLAIVLLARWAAFSMLLTSDAEAEAIPLDPGPVDVLKVAHHGSDDAGLAALLDRVGARLATISVGNGNPFGHPTPATLATLAGHGVRVLRTDRDGTVVLDVARRSIQIGRGG